MHPFNRTLNASHNQDVLCILSTGRSLASYFNDYLMNSVNAPGYGLITYIYMYIFDRLTLIMIVGRAVHVNRVAPSGWSTAP